MANTHTHIYIYIYTFYIYIYISIAQVANSTPGMHTSSPTHQLWPSFTRCIEDRLQLGFEDGVHLLQPASQWQGVGVPHGEGGLAGEDDAWNRESQWPNGPIVPGMWVPWTIPNCRLMMIQYDSIWNMIQYDWIWFNMKFDSIWNMIQYEIWFNMIQFDSLWFNMIHYDSIWFNMIQYEIWFNMIQYDLIWFSVIQYDSIWFNAQLLFLLIVMVHYLGLPQVPQVPWWSTTKNIGSTKVLLKLICAGLFHTSAATPWEAPWDTCHGSLGMVSQDGVLSIEPCCFFLQLPIKYILSQRRSCGRRFLSCSVQPIQI